MKPRQKLKKWIVAGLAVACVVLFFNVISDIGKSAGEAYHAQSPASAPARLQKAPARNAAKLRDLDPSLQVDTLKEYLSRPLPDFARNPFDFGAAPVVSPVGHAPGSGGPAGPGAAPAIPPPPQVSVQALGYSDRAGVGGEAYLADEDQVYVVHKGDVVEKRYTILRITPTQVEVLDGASGQTTQLSIPPSQ